MATQSEANLGPTVVVVDDDEAARLSIGQMLKLRRYRVESFPAAEVALGERAFAGGAAAGRTAQQK